MALRSEDRTAGLAGARGLQCGREVPNPPSEVWEAQSLMRPRDRESAAETGPWRLFLNIHR